MMLTNNTICFTPPIRILIHVHYISSSSCGAGHSLYHPAQRGTVRLSTFSSYMSTAHLPDSSLYVFP